MQRTPHLFSAPIQSLALTVAALASVSVLALQLAGRSGAAEADGTAGGTDPSWAAAPALAASVDQLTRSLTPVADTFVTVSEAPTPMAMPTGQPNGGATTLSTGFGDFGAHRNTALLRFDVPTSEPDMALVYADLELGIAHAELWTVDPPPPATGTMRLTFQRVDETWDEETLASPMLPARAGPTVAADVGWGPCDEAGCGDAVIDVHPLMDRGSPRDDHGLAIRSAPVAPDTAYFGWSFAFGSRESDRPPTLRLAYQPIETHPFLDLHGSAVRNCATGLVDVRLHNDGGLPYIVEIRMEAVGERPRRFAVPPPIPALGSVLYTDVGWEPGTRHYVIDPDGRLPEADRTNNVVPIAMPGCPTPGPSGGRAFVPFAQAGSR